MRALTFVIFAKVSAFGNSKSLKREGFFSRNHGYFSKRETRKFFHIHKIIKMGQFSKVMIYFYFNRRQSAIHWFEFAKLSAKFVPKIAERESFCQIFRVFFDTRKLMHAKVYNVFVFYLLLVWFRVQLNKKKSRKKEKAPK